MLLSTFTSTAIVSPVTNVLGYVAVLGVVPYLRTGANAFFQVTSITIAHEETLNTDVSYAVAITAELAVSQVATWLVVPGKSPLRYIFTEFSN